MFTAKFRFLSSLLLAASLLAGTAAAAALPLDPATAKLVKVDAQAAGISSYLLANGFKIILAPYPSAANVRVELLVKTGSKLEGYGETGMAHLLEHMLFKSAGQRPNLKADLTALGASWNGTTTADRTNFFETLAAEPDKVDEALRIEADRFMRASFTKEHLSSEMTVVRNELERNDSNPHSLVWRALQREAFFWHGYARPTIGARSDIEDAPFATLQAFHKKHYRPDNAALIVSGNFDAPRVLALAAKLFAAARKPDTPKQGNWTREEPRAITNRAELTLPTGMTLVGSGWKLPGQTDRRTIALDLGNSAICDNDWGSLRKDLVLERKIAIDASCGTQIQPDYSLFVANATAGKDADAENLSRQLHTHIEAAAAQGITQAQLDRARQAELNSYERLENSHEQLASLLSQAEVAGDWRLVFWQRDVVKEVTLDEVNAALKKWLVPVNRSDVLLRHADGVVAAELPKSAEAKTLVAGKDWPEVAKLSDPIPASAAELAKLSISVPLPGVAGNTARAALIARKTQGDLAWLVLANDYANQAALSGRQEACTIASSLWAFGGGGLNRDQLSAKLEALQAHWSLNMGGINLEVPRRHLDAALDILLAVWAAPALPENEFEQIKAGSIASIESALKNPAAVAGTAASLRFDNYPAGHPFQPRSLEQQLADIRSVQFADVTRCAADLSGLAQARLALVGAFTVVDVQAIWAKIARSPATKLPYARIKNLDAPLAVDTAPIKVALPEKPNATITGASLLRISDESADFPAMRIAIKVLGGDASSRIWKRLREQDGLAYSAGANLSGSSFEARSGVSLQASAASDKAEAALVGLQDELAKALRDGFSDAEVERAKQAWREERKANLRNEKSFANMLASGLYTGHDYAWLASYDEKIARLTTQEVNAAFRKLMGKAPVVWSVGKGS